MCVWCALAFLNLGLPEIIVIGLVALLLLGPQAGRAMGSLARSLLSLKKDVDDAKSGLRRQIERQIDDAMRSVDEDGEKPSGPPRG